MESKQKTWTVYNPSTGEKLRSGEYLNFEKVDESISELHEVWLSWKKLSYSERQKQVKAVLDHLAAKKETIAKVIHEEMGKTLVQATSEVKKSLDVSYELCAKDLSFLNDYTTESQNYQKAFVKRESFGVILSIMPWNFPLWQTVRMLIPTLLTGNVVLLKHSTLSPTTGDLVAEAFSKIGVMKHVLFDHDMTEKVIAHPFVGGASITGSMKAGEIIAGHCAKHFKKCVLELGGIDAALVLDDADMALAAKRVVESRLQNTGQVCISTKRVFVSQSRIADFLELLKKEFDAVFKDQKFLGPLASSKFKEDYNKNLEHLAKYHKCAYEKQIEPSEKVVDENHTAYVKAVIYDVMKPEDYLRENEIFGPALLVYSYDTVENAIKEMNHTQFGLGASIYTREEKLGLTYAEQIEAGQVALNDTIKTETNLPFGGVKKSGMGHELGKEGFFEFLKVKTYCVS